ncbi:MAG TPA: hypothetical protein VLL54_08045 [Pyrinomonadaceae bacterium]|nr:hypothetical protein [Pyrinomonadaceae bacterium]
MLTRRIFLLLFLCLLAAGCKGTVQKLGDLSKLHAALVKEYGEAGVGVYLTNDVLRITFVNSPLNSKDLPARAERAQQTATFVSQHYPPIKEVSAIWVAFVLQETRFIVFHSTEGLGSYGFDNTGTPLRRPSDFSAVQHTTAAYVAGLKQTDIVVRELQLEGDINDGFLVTPHYTLPGKVTAADPSPIAPKEIRFDFSSSSDKSLFPGAPKITFLADDKVVFETTQQFSTSKYGDKFSEYLSLPIPYPAFVRMTNGKTLTMKIGDREYVFSKEHHDALVEMRAYVKE